MIDQLERNSIRRPNSCITWIGTRNPQGYGKMTYKGRPKYAHRVSAELYLPDFSHELDVLHRCDTPSCINPEHLFMGTDSDNQKDAVSKGRHVTKKSQISKEEQEDIRSMYAMCMSGYAIAEITGHHPTTIYRVIRRTGCYSE